MQGTTLVYMAMELWGNHPPPLPTIKEDDSQNDHGTVTGPLMMNTVTLTATVGKSSIFKWYFNQLLTSPIEWNYPKYVVDLAAYINQLQLPALIRQFLIQ